MISASPVGRATRAPFLCRPAVRASVHTLVTVLAIYAAIALWVMVPMLIAGLLKSPFWAAVHFGAIAWMWFARLQSIRAKSTDLGAWRSGKFE
jgi:hypothetical protein